jgi:threonine dehydratase
MTLSFDDVRRAAERIDGLVERTPLRRSRKLSEATGADVWVKYENQQFTGSFKDRGAANKLVQLSDQDRRRGVITASAGMPRPWPTRPPGAAPAP